MDDYNYDYLLAKDHMAIHLRRPTRERVTTFMTGMVKLARDGSQHERCGTNAKPTKERGSGSIRLVRISIFDSYEN